MKHLTKCLWATITLTLVAIGNAFAQAPTCNQSLTPDCLYFPALEYGIDDSNQRTTSYIDNAGATRTINVQVRIPIGAPVPMPVMIWSHGGAEGKSNPERAMAEWSETTARAGYLTVSIAHTPRSDGERRDLCQSIGINDLATCEVFKHLNWDRPHDIRAVLDELTRLNAQGPFQGTIDVTRIAVGGHSAGAGGALTVGGALRNFTGTPVDLSDPLRRPVAFLAFSPQGPGSEGFFDTDEGRPSHSWMRMPRPVLIGTGDGDSTCKPGLEPGSCIGDTPSGRRIGFARMPPGGKYHLYVHDADAFHGLFALSSDKCPTKGINQQKCDEIARWLQSTALAFLDGHVRQDPNALLWLQSSNVATASRGVASWARR